MTPTHAPSAASPSPRSDSAAQLEHEIRTLAGHLTELSQLVAGMEALKAQLARLKSKPTVEPLTGEERTADLARTIFERTMMDRDAA